MPDILCATSEVTGQGKEVIHESGGKRIYLMLFRHDSGIVAYHNVCPHQGRNLNFAPDRFLFDPAGKLVCPHHGAMFEITDGRCVQGPCLGASLRPVTVVVNGDEVALADPGLSAG